MVATMKGRETVAKVLVMAAEAITIVEENPPENRYAQEEGRNNKGRDWCSRRRNHCSHVRVHGLSVCRVHCREEHQVSSNTKLNNYLSLIA